MTNIRKKNSQPRRKYAKPRIECVLVDKSISLVMMSDPPGDPVGSINPLHFTDNPFKLPNL